MNVRWHHTWEVYSNVIQGCCGWMCYLQGWREPWEFLEPWWLSEYTLNCLSTMDTIMLPHHAGNALETMYGRCVKHGSVTLYLESITYSIYFNLLPVRRKQRTGVPMNTMKLLFSHRLLFMFMFFSNVYKTQRHTKLTFTYKTKSEMAKNREF